MVQWWLVAGDDGCMVRVQGGSRVRCGRAGQWASQARYGHDAAAVVVHVVVVVAVVVFN